MESKKASNPGDLDDYNARLKSYLDMLHKMIAAEEGCRLECYRDSLGHLTIGYGHLVREGEFDLGDKITQERADELLERDLANARRELAIALPWTAGLEPARRAVLVSMVFQMGMTGVGKFRDTLKAIRAGDFAAAASHMMASRWAEQTPLRAKRHAAQLKSGEWYPYA